MISGILLDPRSGRPIVDRDVRAQLEARGWVDVVENLERSRRAFFAAERNPPLFMDVSSAYSGDELGLPYRDLLGQGIVAPTDLAVTAQSGANSVNVAKGACWVVGDTNADLQPNYRCFNDAIVNLGISPDATQARRVRIVGQVTDQGFAGTGRVWALQALHGTPAASPVLPAEPASAISLADVLVPAAAASSAAYTFTDLRSRATIGQGGAAGASALALIQSLAGNGSASVISFTSIPQTYKDLILTMTCRSVAGVLNAPVYVQFNGVTGVVYSDQWIRAVAAVVDAGFENGSGVWIGTMPGANPIAPIYMDAEVLMPDYADTTSHASMFARSGFINPPDADRRWIQSYGGAQPPGSAGEAISSVQVASGNGAFHANSVFNLWGRV